MLENANASEIAFLHAMHERGGASPTLLSDAIRNLREYNETGLNPCSTKLPIEVIGQVSKGRIDLYDMACIMVISEMIEHREILMFEVSAPGYAGRNSDEATNDLTDALEYPYSASFHGGVEDFDGHFNWEAQISVDGLTIDKFWVPFEVGYTKSPTTLGHILFRGGVARWPYGQDRIYVLLQSGIAIKVD